MENAKYQEQIRAALLIQEPLTNIIVRESQALVAQDRVAALHRLIQALRKKPDQRTFR